MQPIGSAAALWRYPVKGLAAQALVSAEVGPEGLAGDRGRALFVRNAGHARFEKTYRGKEQRRLHLCASVAEAVALGAEDALTLEDRGDGPYFDDAAVSLILDGWVADAERLCARPLDVLRFRPNVYVRTSEAFRAILPRESDLTAALVQIGSVRLRVVNPIGRCVTITYDPHTGEADPEIGRTIAQERGNVMGVYCAVERGGSIAAGDTVFLETAA